jgi:hypothetical protein
MMNALWLQESAPDMSIPLETFLQGIEEADVPGYLAKLVENGIGTVVQLQECCNVESLKACGIPVLQANRIVTRMANLKKGKSPGPGHTCFMHILVAWFQNHRVHLYTQLHHDRFESWGFQLGQVLALSTAIYCPESYKVPASSTAN